MAQDIHLPWGLPQHIQINADGVGIPIAFATYDLRNVAPHGHRGLKRNEALLVSDDANVDVHPDALEDEAEFAATWASTSTRTIIFAG